MYRFVFRHVFCHLDPERAHHLGIGAIRVVGRIPGVSAVVHRVLVGGDPRSTVRVFGREVPGYVGIAAGFDKDAIAVRGLGMVGFSHVEVGTVTARAQPGNERPRLRRVLEDEALVNRMGFNNKGAKAAGERLRHLRASTAGRAPADASARRRGPRAQAAARSSSAPISRSSISMRVARTCPRAERSSLRWSIESG